MAIFYSDSDRGDAKIDVWRMDGTKAYLRHYDNYLYLDFVSRSSRDPRERAQARSELAICERKLSFWRKHPRYEHEDAMKGVAEKKAQWARG